MEAAVQLIYFDETGKLQTKSSGLQALSNIPDNFGINSVVMVGDGRIGKSSLLNQIAGKEVFEVGSTTTRVTRGIWIYIRLDYTCKRAYLYCDVEGFGNPSKVNGKTADERLLIIVSLICNMIVFNIKGVYDSELLQKLEFTCVLVEKFRKKNKVLSNPGLVVVLRDFDLDLPKSPDDDLKQLLGANQRSPIRFRSVKAFTLVRPAEREKLRRLKDLPNSALDTVFVKERNRLQAYLMSEAEKMCSQTSQFISGKVLVELIQETIKAVNNEDLGNLTQTLTDLRHQYNQRYTKAALKSYEQQVTSNWPSTTAPETVRTSVLKWKRKIKGDLEEKLLDFDVSVVEILQRFEDETEALFDRISKEKCERELARVRSTFDINLRQNTYNVIGGHERYLLDRRRVETEYQRLNNLGPRAKSVWETYETKLQLKEERIQANEQTLLRLQALEREAAQARGYGIIGMVLAGFVGAFIKRRPF